LRLGSNLYYLLITFLLVGFLATTGCYKFNGNQTIPAYLSINNININTFYLEEGTNSSDITNAWIYVDDALIGVYEIHDNDTISATFPILAEGKHKLEIRPGINLNGISSTKVPYPFYKSIIYNDFDFIPGTLRKLGNLTTTYYDGIKFPWKEDFELPEISIEKTSWSDTNIIRTSPANNPVAFLSENSKYSGVINLTTDKEEYAGTTFNSYDVLTAGSIIMLEMNFKTDNYLVVGLLIRDEYEVVSVDLIILNHTDEWKKIYINLGANLSLHPKALDYKLIFKSGLESESTSAKVYIDNLKIVHR